MGRGSSGAVVGIVVCLLCTAIVVGIVVGVVFGLKAHNRNVKPDGNPTTAVPHSTGKLYRDAALHPCILFPLIKKLSNASVHKIL
jgi:hypothetical protein